MTAAEQVSLFAPEPSKTLDCRGMQCPAPILELSKAARTMGKQPAVLEIIVDDVARLDRLISDISDASRLDAELARAASERVDLGALLQTLVDVHRDRVDAPAPQLRLTVPPKAWP